MTMQQTIFALSSGLLPSGVAVVRLSGPAALRIGADLCAESLPPPRRASATISLPVITKCCIPSREAAKTAPPATTVFFST